jgi:hypothetical protein
MKQVDTASAPWDSAWAVAGSGRIGEVTEGHFSGSPMRRGTPGSGIITKWAKKIAEWAKKPEPR